MRTGARDGKTTDAANGKPGSDTEFVSAVEYAANKTKVPAYVLQAGLGRGSSP